MLEYFQSRHSVHSTLTQPSRTSIDMRWLLLLALLSSCIGQDAFKYDDPAFIGSLKNPVSEGCVTTCAGVACEKFEGTLDLSWTQSGNSVTSVVTEARGTCSTKFWRITNPSIGDTYFWSNSTSIAVCYIDLWFRIKSSALSDAGRYYIIWASTIDPLTCIRVGLSNNAGQLIIIPADDNGSTYTPQNISADTWYHIRFKWDNTGNTAEWFLSTTDTFGAAIDQVTPATTRSVIRLWIGRNAGGTGSGNVVLDFDSIAIGDSGYVRIEYQ